LPTERTSWIIGRAIILNKLLLLVLLLLAVIATATAATFSSKAQERDREASIVRLAELISERVSSQVSVWLGLHDAGRDFFEISGSPHPAQMLELQIRLKDRFPAVRFASFVRRVTDEERLGHVSEMRELGFTDYEIKDLTPAKYPFVSPVRSDYYPAAVPGVEGWDLGNDPDIGPIITDLKFNDRSSSKLVTARVGKDLEPVLIAFYPVYENQDLSGFFFIGLDPRDLLGGVLDEFEDQVAIEILLAESPVPASTTDYLYRSADFKTIDDRVREKTISVKGELWIVRVKEASNLPSSWPGWLLPGVTAVVAVTALATGGIILILVQQRRDAVETANRLQKLGEAKDRILSTVSHELKTPLTSILAFADILRKNQLNHLDENELNQLEIISRNGVHLDELIDDVLDVSRLSAGALNLNIRTFEIREFVFEIRAEFDPLLSKNHQTLVVTIDCSEAHLSADRHRMVQVLSNLISNASKYSDEGSNIWLTVSNAGGNTVFTVHDEGIGISAENVQRVGEPFFRVESELARKVGGTGLGIFVVKSIVELHGGVFELTSKVGHGTTVTLELPTVREVHADDARAVDPVSELYPRVQEAQ